MNLLAVFKKEYYVWIPSALLCFVAASVVMSGFPEGLLPNVSYPFIWGGDSWLGLDYIQRISDGSVYENVRQGWPFGSKTYDYPIPDMGSVFFIKLLSFVFSSPVAIYNIYFLSGFALCFIAAYGVLRCLGLNKAFSLCGSLLYAFLPFHFFRIGHLYYTFYFVAPLYFYYGYMLFKGSIADIFKGWKNIVGNVAAIAFLASFGVYYSAFGMLTIFTGGFMGSLALRSFRPVLTSVAICFIIVLSCVAYLWQPLYHTALSGKNPEAVSRSYAEAEIYGFKIIQLFLPPADHRSQIFQKISKKYIGQAPLVNENVAASLGLLGSLGFVFLVFYIFIKISGTVFLYPPPDCLSFLSGAVLIQTFFGTIGGAGSFIAFLTPLIRGYNRISIFIAFGCIAGFFIVLDFFIKKKFPVSPGKFKIISVSSALFLCLFGLWDQVGATHKTSSGAAYFSDKRFINAIEEILPPGASVYQMPYMRFPEMPGIGGMTEYSHARGFILSKNLNWNYGGMKARRGSDFFLRLAAMPVEKQLDIASKMGFEGVYIDNRGFGDGGASINLAISSLLGKKADLVSEDGSLAFYRMEKSPSAISPEEIEDIINEVFKPGEEISFKRMDILFFRGFSGPEADHIWTEGFDSSISLGVSDPDKFSGELDINCWTLGPQRIVISLNGHNICEKDINLASPGTMSCKFNKSVLKKGNNIISFYLPNASPPRGTGDPRYLAMAFQSLVLR